ncbi:MAG: hypothetical protein MJB12_03160, partial [Firmicutes bacterium]|nr:hypothetical protein [Bacillota bacterium]
LRRGMSPTNASKLAGAQTVEAAFPPLRKQSLRFSIMLLPYDYISSSSVYYLYNLEEVEK